MGFEEGRKGTIDALIISVESQNIENGAPGSSAGFGATSGLDMKRLFE
ncbi:MAG: hypothetical protein ACXWIU_11320 [Limisphaerales bacterium]